MPTKYPEIFAALGAPFDAEEVKTRAQSGRTLSYVTARTVQIRLDNVVGPENWTAEYTPFSENSVRCRLSVRLPDDRVIVKEGIGGHAGMADAGDDDKSGVSDSLKRAGVEYGIARQLYGDGVSAFVQERYGLPGPSDPTKVQPGQTRPARPDPPREPYPEPARGQRQPERPPAPAHQNGHGGGDQPRPGGGQNYGDRPPTSGKALYAWTRKAEEEHGAGLLKYLNQFGQLQEFPGRMIDWSGEQVALAYGEAVRKLQSATGGGRDERPAPQTVPSGDQSDPDDDDVPF